MPTESHSGVTAQYESRLQCYWLPVHRLVSCKLAIISNYLTECIIDLCITKLLLRYMVTWHIINLLNINQLLVEDFANYLLHNIRLVSFSSHTLVIEAVHVIDRHTIWIVIMHTWFSSNDMLLIWLHSKNEQAVCYPWWRWKE